MTPLEKSQQLERKAKERRERQAKENRERFPILTDPFVKEVCDKFNGKVIYVENNKGENIGRK
jgi:hypothetical protein